MRRSSVFLTLLGAMGMAGFLSACSDGSPSASASAGGAGGSGSASASGTVTGFGSIFVNGKKFETDGSFVSIDDRPANQCTVSSTNRCGLQKGMTVKVSGSFNGSTNQAVNIIQDDTLDGPITSKDSANSQFSVLGQTVLVDETTKFDSGVTFAGLAVGNVVEVSGFLKSDGVIVASFIELKGGAAGCAQICEVKGVVKNHNHATTSFQIGGLTVVYDNSTLIDNSLPLPNGSNWNDLFVEVKGASLVGLTLTATKVERENDGVDNGNVVDEFEIEGFVTQVGAASGNIIEFTIGATPIRTTANTEFRGGTVDEIVLGAKMSAEGRFDGSTLIAKHVKFHANVKLEGNITNLNGTSFEIEGLPGITVVANSQTEGGSNLVNGNHVRVRGRVNGTSSVIATRIEQRSGNTNVDLQGPVQSVAGQSLTILGVSVDTASISNNNFEGIDDQAIGGAAFFAAVQQGTLVKVKGQLNGTTVDWNEAELED